jgi:hypothetical protein
MWPARCCRRSTERFLGHGRLIEQKPAVAKKAK